MSKIDIDGNILDSFHIAFYHDKSTIDPKYVSMGIEEELYDRLHVCRELKKAYVVYVLIAELEGDNDAISQRQESKNEERVLAKHQA